MVLAVGLALLLAAVPAAGSWRPRTLIAAAGVTWFLPSLVPAAVLVHQAVLLLLLVCFPGGRPRGRLGWALGVTALPVALLLVPQPAVAGLFTAAAVAALPGLRADATAQVFPVVAGTALASVLGGSWALSRLAPDTFDPAAALRSYELVLLALAAGFVVASRAVVADRARLADRLLVEDRPVDLGGLAAVLSAALRDPQLRIRRHGEEPSPGAPAGRLEVRDGDRTVAVVEHASAALEDDSTAAAVAAAVRLVAQNLDRRAELRSRTDDLREARNRVVAAADRQRESTAARLRTDVLDPLSRTAAALRGGGVPGSAPAAEAVEVAVSEMDAAVLEIRDLVGGVPSAALGGGRLRSAVDALAAGSPLPVTVAGRLSADPALEAILFYVCSEALTNAAKHSGASSVTVELLEDERSVRLSVTDDGAGRADPAGLGLRGLADRLAAHDGRLRVDSPPGAGTTVTAAVPRQAILR